MSDALTTLRAALTPREGLRRIPLPTESYQWPSGSASAKTLLNLYAEAQPPDARSQVALLTTPGLTPWATLGRGPILAMTSDLSGRLYVVSGDHLWRIIPTNLGPPQDLGFIGLPDANAVMLGLPVTIAVGVNAAVVCVPPKAFVVTHALDASVHEIAGGFPGARSVAYLDGYFLFTSAEDGSRFFVSRLADPSAYDALDFAYADAVPNIVLHVVRHQGEVWLMGQGGIEIWYDSGDADFPFRRQSGGVIERGVVNPNAIATGDGSVWWLGFDDVVYRSQGFSELRVSTPWVEAVIHAEGPVVSSLCWNEGGHQFYGLNFSDRTIAYDCLTKCWHERSSSPVGVGRWRANAAMRYHDRVLLGDASSGTVWLSDPGADTDAGVPIFSAMVTPPIWPAARRGFCARVEIEMEVGAPQPPHAMLLQWSDDGGATWTAGRALDPGVAGAARKRVAVSRLGSFRQRAFRVTARGRVKYYGLDAALEVRPQ